MKQKQTKQWISTKHFKS